MDNKEKLLKIMEACMELNTLSERKRELTGYLPTVFFEFSGHVAWIGIKVYKTGWFPDADADIDIRIDVDEPISDEVFENTLNELRKAWKPIDVKQVLEKDIEGKERHIKEIMEEIDALKGQLNEMSEAPEKIEVTEASKTTIEGGTEA